MDQFKSSEIEEISEAAFEVDVKIKYNIGIIDPKKFKYFQKIEIIKM